MRSNDTLPELLAPAGSPQALEAAIEGGADAVYFGGGRFNARMRAKNFCDDELREAIRLCHAYGVKTNVTVNTRLRDHELPEVLEEVELLQDAGADALIVADLGAAAYIRERFPELPLHASTQLSGSTATDARILQSLGFSRMVCPRELSLTQLTALAKASPIGIEAFLHGAHCVSFSGQCLLSAAMGGRSGNRGECAQPCRLPFSVCASGRCSRSPYPLSLSDLCLARHVRELILSGVESLKIEGRQRSPSYVYGVTRIYRRLLDERRDAVKDEIDELAGLFSRDGFTDGYFRGQYRGMLGIRHEEDKNSASDTFPGLRRKIPVDASVRVCAGEPMSLTLTVGSRSVTVTGDVPSIARTSPATEESVRKSIAKFGATPFVLNGFHAFIGEGLFVLPAQLNALRRSALEALLAPPVRAKADQAPFRYEAPAPAARPRFTAEFLSPAQIPAEAETYFDEIYLPLSCHARERSVRLPDYVTDRTLAQTEAALAAARPRSVLVHSLAQLDTAVRLGIPAVASLRLNCWNLRCADELLRLGAESVTPSPELPLGAVRALPAPKTVLAYGRLPLMLLLRCAISDGGGECPHEGPGGFTEDKEKPYLCRAVLKDRKNASFPLVGMYDCTNLLCNSVPLYMADRMDDLFACAPRTLHFIFTPESREEAARVIRAYQTGAAPETPIRRWK